MSDAVASLVDVQEELVELLEADPYFADIPIFTQRKKNIENEIALALGTITEKAAGKIGLCIVVVMPLAEMSYPNLPGYFDKVPQVLRVLENVTLNTIGKKAEDVAVHIVATIHGRFLYSESLNAGDPATVVVDKKAITIGDEPDKNLLSYDVVAWTQAKVSYTPDLVAPPSITIVSAGAQMEIRDISCATAGATIYQTINGTRPKPGNTLALVLPYQLPLGTKVLARAYKAGLRASEIVEQIA